MNATFFHPATGRVPFAGKSKPTNNDWQQKLEGTLLIDYQLFQRDKRDASFRAIITAESAPSLEDRLKRAGLKDMVLMEQIGIAAGSLKLSQLSRLAQLPEVKAISKEGHLYAISE